MDVVFRAIADPTRRGILDSLAKREESVTEIAKGFDISLPAVSQHLRVLQTANLITGHRKGRQIIYRLNPIPLREVSRWIKTYERFWEASLDRLEAHLKKFNP
jgi:DNA-binding transcriptional ArsR family regulator